MAGPDATRAALLLLTDARLPAGGHAHSGGLESAVDDGRVHDLASLGAFLEGRLWTVGLVDASLAAATAHRVGPAGADATAVDWSALAAEAAARTASPALRAVARLQGRMLARTARVAWPSAVLDELPEGLPAPVVLGAVAAAAGLSPHDAALAAGYQAVTGPATAAVRLLGLDPVAVHAQLAALGPALEAVADEAVACAAGPMADIPAPSGLLSEVAAEAHDRLEVRLFAS